MTHRHRKAFEAVEELELPAQSADRIQSYEETFGWQPAHLPVASAVWERLVSLPIFPTMSEAEIGHVTATVRDLARVAASVRRGRS